MKYIIIGSGVAGIAAIEALRSVDRTGEVMLIGDDPHGFYSRPGLAYYLTGELHDRALFPRTAADFRQLGFSYVKARVAKIMRAEHLLQPENQPSLSYDRLLIAVGARAMPLEVPGADLEGILKL
ncbi:MAG TPA: FAD-dependent oxidoreductase, partial [Anaerolineales bacterium]|nr:FAD-dependent oxidoreductase [Anaerolineales bacterium]